jgi:6-phosphogluconolactonase (cycloisomerase 2 family)
LSFVEARKHANVTDDLVFFTGTDRPRITVAPNGAHVYFERGGVANGFAMIEVLERDGGTGALDSVQALDRDGTTVSGAPSGITVSPDDEHVYVAAASARSTFAYDRDPGTGLLAFVEFHDTLGVLEGRDVAVSPDGADVYVLGRESFANGETRIQAFARDAGSGALTPTVVVDQIPDFNLGASLALSGDGANAYVGVDTGAAVASLARDQATGALSVVSTVKDGVGGATGLLGVQRVAVAPDGGHVFAVSYASSALGVLRRQAGTGELSFVETHTYGDVGAEPLSDTRDVLVSPDSQFVYAFGRAAETFTVFAPSPSCTPTPKPSCQAAGKGKLKIKTPGADKKRVLVWKWQSTVVPAVGDPLATSDVALCLYDASPASQPRLDAVAPAGGTCGARPCWQPIGAVLKYADKERTPDGLQKIKIVPKPGATSTIVTKARGANVPTFSLPLTGAVTVQLQSSTGECLEATFSSATLNDATQFLAVL